MKKSVLVLSVLLVLFTGISCASKVKNQNDELSADETAMLTEEERIALEKKIAEEKMLNLEWIKKDSKNVDVTQGIVRLRARKTFGTFNLGAINDMGKTIPGLSTANEYVTSSLYLKAGSKIIRLNQDSAVKSYSRKTEKGMQIAYVIDRLATVIIDFECFSSDPKNSDLDTVKITSAVKNTGKKRESFELKMILDTILGETDRHHFYDSSAQPVKSEMDFVNPIENNWFVSQNSNASMIFTFAGLEAEKAKQVALANFNTLDVRNWKPDMLTYRAFDTVLSYNNSAVGVIWEGEKLSVNESYSRIFYITFTTEEGKIKENPLLKKTTSQTSGKVDKTDSNKNKNETKTEEKKVTPAKENPVTEEKSAAKTQSAVEESGKEIGTSKTAEITDDKFSDEYIKALLKRIESLNENDEISKAELDELNRELDMIIEMKRK